MVNISEQVMFELAGMDEVVLAAPPTVQVADRLSQSQKTQEPAKGVGALLNMDTFSALRHLRNRVASGELTDEQVRRLRR